MGEHCIIFILNLTYTLCTLFECLIVLKLEKAKTKKAMYLESGRMPGLKIPITTY